MIRDMFLDVIKKYTRSYWNRVVHKVVLACTDGEYKLSSQQIHRLLGEWHREVYPEYKDK